MFRPGQRLASALLALCVSSTLVGQTTAAVTGEKLRHVQTLERDDLAGVARVVSSPDGKFIYAAAHRASAVVGFARDPKTGKLEFLQSHSDEDHLRGVTEITLNSDGRYAVATAFESRTVVLFRRNPTTGRLDVVTILSDGDEPKLLMKYPIAASFVPGSRLIYVADDAGRSADSPQGALHAFRVTEAGKLKWLGTDEGQAGCYFGARDVGIALQAKLIFVPCKAAHTLVVADFDAKTGKTRVRQVLRDGQQGINGLSGVFGVAVSPDGQFVCVASGRFAGDDGVSVFALDGKGSLKPVQELHNDRDGLHHFEGGNSIRMTSDGKRVYATASRSNALACFQRDAKTGKLTLLEVLTDGKPNVLEGAAGLGISPDGRFIYVAAEAKQAICVFQRP
jgi:6-phosphogluconolactonase (cycloisomerase 2 family)